MATVDDQDATGAKAGSVELDDAMFGIEPNVPVMHQVVTAQLAARRSRHAVAPRPAPRCAAAAPSRGSRRAPAGPARARSARPTGAAAASPSAPSPAATPSARPRRWSAWRCASALSDRAAERQGPGRRPGASTAPSTKARHRRCWRAIGVEGRVLVVLRAEDDGRVEELPQPRRRPHLRHGELNAYDVLVSATGSSSPRPRCPATARSPAATHAAEEATVKDPRDIILAPVVSEKSYGAARRQRLHVQGRTPTRRKPEIHDAVESIFDVKVAKVNTLNRKGKRKRNRRTGTFGKPARHQARHRHPRRGRLDRPVRGIGRRMALRKRKPTSPGRRFQTVSDFNEITKDQPERSLLAPKPNTGGRNNHGRKTARHRGGGHKQQYRIIDFRRNKDGVPAKVAAIEYDPNRNCRIVLLHYLDGEKRYILAPQRREGRRPARSRARAPRSAPATRCRCATSRSAPPCTTSSCKPGGGGKMARSRRLAACSSWPRRATSPPCACPAPRCAACRSTAGPPSARSATPRPS